MAPSGASTGKYEALELRDRDPQRYLGRGVLLAVRNVNDVIGPALEGLDVTDQRTIDPRMIELDGTRNNSVLGANAILAVSVACLRTGGLHAIGSADLQECMIMPVAAPTLAEAVRWSAEIFHTLGVPNRQRSTQKPDEPQIVDGLSCRAKRSGVETSGIE